MTLRRLLPVLIVLALSGLALVAVSCLAEEPAPAPASPFKNVQILKHVTDKKEMRLIMKAQAKALGVKCTYCHVQGKFDLDDKEHKRKARDMMRMTQDINERYFPKAEESISCWTCHRGHDEPQLTRPIEDAVPAQPGFEAAPEEP